VEYGHRLADGVGQVKQQVHPGIVSFAGEKDHDFSGAVCRAHFRREQETHARARFSAVVGPPAVRGSTWSR